jgi:hypothetical protein
MNMIKISILACTAITCTAVTMYTGVLKVSHRELQHDTELVAQLRQQVERIAIRNANLTVTIEQIDVQTKHLRLKVPLQYRQFLALSNGGYPTLNCFDYIEKGEPSLGEVAWFQALADDTHERLLYSFDAFDGRVPNRFFPVARDSGGNLICISTLGLDEGCVYFWVKDNEDAGESAAHFVAPSFVEFLGKLRRSTFVPPTE